MNWIDFKRVGICCLVFLKTLSMLWALNEEDDRITRADDAAQVVVRAVFINCEPDDRVNVSPDNEATRFEREELFKHSALRNCCKKLAVTVKLASEPNKSSSDEYLPIEHVFEGVNKKRVRLLDPYILRLHRELPLQAYKLRRLDTVTGILANSDGEFDEKYKRQRGRSQRDLAYYRQESSVNETTTSIANFFPKKANANDCVNRDICTYHDRVRKKRNEHNIVVEDTVDNKHSRWISKDHSNQRFDRDLETPGGFEESLRITSSDENYDGGIKLKQDNKKHRSDKKHHLQLDHKTRRFHIHNHRNPFEQGDDNNRIVDKTRDFGKHNTKTKQIFDDKSRKRMSHTDNNLKGEEKDYDVYEIGKPELWYNAQLQLFQKLSTPEGKTLWNDLTKGEQASVSSLSPEWMGQDLNVRYRPDEWLPRDQYTLPTNRLCLLTPAHDADSNYADNPTSFNGEDYIVIPIEDIMGWQEDGDIGDSLNKRDANYSNSFSSTSTEESDKLEKRNRKVIVRTSRALLKGSEDKVNFASQGSDRYLTLPHHRLHHAQIDLEARADKNELVLVGASGRISTAVADSTRRTRTVIMVQVANTGLAAARFRVIARDCGPALAKLMNGKENSCVTNPVLLPPRHTRNLRIELPVEMPLDTAHCSVALLNDDDQSVAVREVTIKKGDRCFCVWHCDCVCLSNDPKLLCREMAEARQAAAGLSIRDRPRHSRSICYTDDATTNVLVVIVGVIVMLLFLGFMKACVGLVCPRVSTWGLGCLLQMPRKIDRYYERSIASRPVEYDEQGWPVHPDTKKRTVHLVSWPMEFILNVIFFVSLPCVVIQQSIKKCLTRCTYSKLQNQGDATEVKKLYSSQDMQGVVGRWRRRRGGLRRWMRPEAQNLSTDIWQKGLFPMVPTPNDIMKPLLMEQRAVNIANDTRDSEGDSEKEDTEYVLTQMQKSRESLARSQKKLSDPDSSLNNK